MADGEPKRTGARVLQLLRRQKNGIHKSHEQKNALEKVETKASAFACRKFWILH
jgi:hypothetical protein